ncbi:unnamed protein product [Peronospora farinosa]|nr:unnamed protein product [Peronospora farinosa]
MATKKSIAIVRLFLSRGKEDDDEENKKTRNVEQEEERLTSKRKKRHRKRGLEEKVTVDIAKLHRVHLEQRMN